MKKNPTIHRAKALPTLAIALSSFIGLAQSSKGDVTVLFTEEGPDVRVSFDGTLQLDGSPTQFIGGPGVALIGGASVYEVSGPPSAGYFYDSTGGDFSPGVPFVSNSTADSRDHGPLSFGYTYGTIVFDPSHVTGGTVDNPTELTVSPADTFFILRNQSLVSLNADSLSIAEGTVLWTANTTNDTLIFSSSAVSPIPEVTGSSVLLGLLGLSLFGRRRQR